MDSFPNKLKALRKHKNVSQQIVADNLGITQQAYGLYERGKREPNLETLARMSLYFGRTVDWLLGEFFTLLDPMHPIEMQGIDGIGENKNIGLITKGIPQTAKSIKTIVTDKEHIDYKGNTRTRETEIKRLKSK
jgi:transcriptional regulator with XRE-family HTH domain